MTPEAIHKLSAGILLAIVGPLLAAEAGVLRGAWTKYILGTGALLMGAFLVLDPIVFHGGSFGAEGVQHQIQGAVAAAVGVVELARGSGRLQARGWGLLLPIGLVAVGVMFAAHTQHSTASMRAQLALHRILGVTVVLMAIVRAVDVLGWAKSNWARIGWLLLGLGIALQLFLYAEDPSGHGAMPMPHDPIPAASPPHQAH